MEQKHKERLTGAVVLLLLAVILIPLALDDTRVERGIKTTNIPTPPDTEFSTRLTPIPAPGEVASGAGATGATGAPNDALVSGARARSAALTGWVVQVGSLSRNNAEALNDRLRTAGYRSYIVDEPVTATDGSALYQVRVGPEALRSEVEALQDELKKKLDLDGFIVDYP